MCGDECVSPLMNTCVVCVLACPTVESEGLGEGQNSNVPAVVINVSIYKGQIAAVVNNGLHLCHVGIDWLIIDGAKQHTPTINKAIPPSMKRVKEEDMITSHTIS